MRFNHSSSASAAVFATVATVPRNQHTLQVESVMKEAAVAVPMQTSELLLVQDVGLEQLAKASASMENNLRVRIVARCT